MPEMSDFCYFGKKKRLNALPVGFMLESWRVGVSGGGGGAVNVQAHKRALKYQVFARLERKPL